MTLDAGNGSVPKLQLGSTITEQLLRSVADGLVEDTC